MSRFVFLGVFFFAFVGRAAVVGTDDRVKDDFWGSKSPIGVIRIVFKGILGCQSPIQLDK